MSRSDYGQMVKAEGNFEDHPYFTVGNQRNSDGVLNYVNTIRTRDGQELQQLWTVRAVQGYGLPGTLDQDVYVALLQIVHGRGGVPEDGWIDFTIYEIMRLLGRTLGGRDYEQVKRSLERLASTSISTKNSFYRKHTKSYLSDETFHLLDKVKHSQYTDSENERGSWERTWVKLSDFFVESYRANYLKTLDSEFYWSLNSSVAKRLYRLIDKKRNHQHRWEVDLFSLRDRIPLSQYRYPSKIREKLEPAHKELKHNGFLRAVTYRNTERGEQLACYEIEESFSTRKPRVELDGSAEAQMAVERLRAEGVRADVATELVAGHGPERCLRYCEALTYQKNIRRRAGWLKRAIEERYELDVPAVVSGSDRGSRESGASAGTSTSRSGAVPQLELPVTVDSVESSASDSVKEDSYAASELRAVLDAVREEVGGPSLSVWFDGSVATSLLEGRLTLVAPNERAAEYIRFRFSEILDRCISARLGTGSCVYVTSVERSVSFEGAAS